MLQITGLLNFGKLKLKLKFLNYKKCFEKIRNFSKFMIEQIIIAEKIIEFQKKKTNFETEKK